jgi:DNA-binding NtrC family response regulator
MIVASLPGTTPESRYRILFVDDEPHMLSALRRMLMPQRARWAMTFVEGGMRALEALERESFDVLISDMRMPGMDGAALLSEVQRLYPRTYRMVLSGYAEAAATTKVMQVAQRFLNKPCDPSDLIAAIEQGCGSIAAT